MFFAIIKLWLKDCTEEASHNECQVTAEVKLPTRLIDVGSQSAPSLRLIETATEKSWTMCTSHYHTRGATPKHTHRSARFAKTPAAQGET